MYWVCWLLRWNYHQQPREGKKKMCKMQSWDRGRKIEDWNLTVTSLTLLLFQLLRVEMEEIGGGWVVASGLHEKYITCTSWPWCALVSHGLHVVNTELHLCRNPKSCRFERTSAREFSVRVCVWTSLHVCMSPWSVSRLLPFEHTCVLSHK